MISFDNGYAWNIKVSQLMEVWHGVEKNGKTGHSQQRTCKCLASEAYRENGWEGKQDVCKIRHLSSQIPSRVRCRQRSTYRISWDDASDAAGPARSRDKARLASPWRDEEQQARRSVSGTRDCCV